jgi:hypothetical protein
MALQDAVQNDRHTGQQITWYYVGTTTPKPLTNATITGTITDVATGTVRAITGTLAVTSGAGGVFTWAYSAADVLTVGTYVVQFTATYTDTLLDSSFEAPWAVRVRRGAS